MLTSLRAVPGAPVDLLSDYDVALIVADPDELMAATDWFAGIGQPLLTVRDGVVINQAFLDAVECRRANGWLEAQAAPPAQP